LSASLHFLCCPEIQQASRLMDGVVIAISCRPEN
jgi:hypothetical protein